MKQKLLREVRALRLQDEFQRLKGKILSRLEKVCTQGRFILGEEVETLERSFSKWLGVPYAIGCASGSDALLLSLMALGIGKGDEVITTAFSFFASASTIVRAGATPVFVDIDPNCYTIDSTKIEKKITEKTKAILPVHLYGQPCRIDRIRAISEKHRLAVIEDCAQAHGSCFDGAKVGTFGELACFSFFPTKNLGGYGDGGMVTTRDESLDKEIRSLRVHGAVKKYHHRRVGINSRLDEIQAAVLNVKLEELDETLKKRREKAAFYTRLLQERDLPVKVPQEEEGGFHTFHQYTLRTVEREALLECLNRAGIEAAVYYPVPLHREEAFGFLSYREGDFPEAERASRELLSLPLNPELTDEDQSYVVDKIEEFFAAR